MSTPWNEHGEQAGEIPDLNRDLPEQEATVETPTSEPAAVVSMVICWRCSLLTQQVARCTHCDAALIRGEPVGKHKLPAREKTHPLLRLLLAYFITLCVSLGWAIYLHSSLKMSESERETGIIVVECLDLLITVSLFVFLGRIVLTRPAVWIRVLCWILAPLVSVGMYLLTHWYVESLRRYVNLDWLYVRSHMELSLLMVILVAVQPAIVEELFFRYFAYGTLRQLMNVNAAVVLSALMFALAHLHNPLGLPFLFGMGLSLGYARAGSGGLLLPMLMHFGHNLAVLYFESTR